MGDLSLADRVMNLESVVKRLDELIAELKDDKREIRVTDPPIEIPKRRGNPNWIKRVIQEDQ